MLLRLTIITAVLLANALALLAPGPALAEPGRPLISELQTGTASSTGDEFVELYNPGSTAVDLSGWKLQYHSAANQDCSDKTWDNKVTVGSGSIPAHGFFLLSSSGYLTSADATFSPGLAYSGGAVRMAGTAGIEDSLAWGNSVCGNDDPAPAPAGGSSLERRPGADIENGGNAYDTGHNAADFQVRTAPQPQSSASPAEVPVMAYAPAPVAPSDGLSAVELSELLPDPAAPLTDANDEFIELYNPNATSVNIGGFVIKTGSSLATKHKLPDVTIGPAEYVALKSADTKISLSNAGSSVALFDPQGHQVGVTITYGKAPTGDAWARTDSDSWAWTTTPTPGSANVLTAPDPSVLAAAASSSEAKAAKASRTTAGKSAKAKTTKAKSSKGIGKLAAPALTAASTPGGHWLLFSLAGLTIAYVIYEFRNDLRSYYYRLRGLPKARRRAG
jgi:hypothetical protein